MGAEKDLTLTPWVNRNRGLSPITPQLGALLNGGDGFDIAVVTGSQTITANDFAWRKVA